ncbi:MAG: hypothetical protein V4503_00755 [Gemmatimonadota bacterium]
MTDCERLRDRMPAVAHGSTEWGAEDAAHLRACGECDAEWQLVARGAMLGRSRVVDIDRVARNLSQRLRHEPVAVPGSRWRSARIGLLAVAAGIALFFLVPITRQPGAAVAGVSHVTVLPELDRLSEDQLQAVLTELDAGDDGLSPMRLPRIGDLTEHQLELVLRELEG